MDKNEIFEMVITEMTERAVREYRKEPKVQGTG